MVCDDNNDSGGSEKNWVNQSQNQSGKYMKLITFKEGRGITKGIVEIVRMSSSAAEAPTRMGSAEYETGEKNITLTSVI